ncbi:MAG: winged helix-turn-helix domain-containing protein [Acidobacteria bacterium]|nr:winged helix-turn-helix domain-containing protein [Acidobacteriota bacterium]
MVAERYRVADLVVDAGAGMVTRGKETVSLSPLTFDLLVTLVRRAPHVVRRHELLAAVWPNEFVSEDTLSQRVRLLREALEDVSGEPRYVASLRGWGYKIVAPVERLENRKAPIRALAVLPLANLTGDPEQEYFADGMTETLISALARIRALKVISRTSVMHYKHADRRLPQIARELGVDAVIEGTVLLAGGRVRVSAQLVFAATDEHLWAESYDRDLGDVLQLHADIARSIAREVRAVVTPEERVRLGERRWVDPVAHEADLRARHFFAKLTPPDVERAIALFEQAVDRDPSFAGAHASLAHACFVRAVQLGAGLSVAEQRELLTKSRAAATRALAIDETAALAHIAIGGALLFLDWNWREAGREAERALELEPNLCYAHTYRAALAGMRLDRTTTLAELRRAIELDPVSLDVRSQAAECCCWVRDYSQAVKYATEALDLDPSYARAHFVLGRVFEAQGRIDEAIGEHERAGMITAGIAAAARRALRQGGAAGYHRWAVTARFGGRPPMGSSPGGGPRMPRVLGERPYFRAKNHARLGEFDEAIRCLEQACEEREVTLVMLKAHEWWDPLRSDPRFAGLVRRVGVP